MKGPAIFLAQFMGDTAPFNSFENITKWASDLGYVGVQIPVWDSRVVDLKKLSESATYCDEIKGKAKNAGMEITELSSHLLGQLVAVHPAYNELFDGFAPKEVHNNPKARTDWAINQLLLAAKASKNLGLNAHGTFSGSLAWPYIYPWPQRPGGLIEEAFKELAKRWVPILNAFADAGVDLCYELHPGEDLHDGITFERFYEAAGKHSAIKILYDPSHYVLQQLNYLDNIDIYHEFIKMFHVKDAEFNPTGRSGIYGGYQSWVDRPGRFRSLGDGQVDFNSIFSKLAQYDYKGWCVLEWECALKHPEDGAAEGAPFIEAHMIRKTERAFDDFADAGIDNETNKKILGLV